MWLGTKSDISAEWTFSRAFTEFSESHLPEHVHESLIKTYYQSVIVGHNSREKGKERIKEPTRLEKQAAGMGLPEMLADLPNACDVGTKKNSKGYKLHIDSADGGIPISCVLTSAPVNDSQRLLFL